MERLLVVAVVSPVARPVPTTARVVAAVRTPCMPVAMIIVVNPNIIIAEKAVVVAAVVVAVIVRAIRGGVRIIHARAHKSGAKQEDPGKKKTVHEYITEEQDTLFGRISSPQLRIFWVEPE